MTNLEILEWWVDYLSDVVPTTRGEWLETIIGLGIGYYAIIVG